MDPSRPAVFSLHFGRAFRISDAGEVALEDYARVLAVAERAEAVRESSPGHAVSGVRLTAPAADLPPAARRDIEDFARDLAAKSGGSGLGWT